MELHSKHTVLPNSLKRVEFEYLLPAQQSKALHSKPSCAVPCRTECEYCRLSSILNVYRCHYCDLMSCLCVFVCVLPQLIIWRKFHFDNDLRTLSPCVHKWQDAYWTRLYSFMYLVLLWNVLVSIASHCIVFCPCCGCFFPFFFTKTIKKTRERDFQKAITLAVQRDVTFCYDLHIFLSLFVGFNEIQVDSYRHFYRSLSQMY